MTPRQREVAALIAQGFNNREIARQLSLETKSVENHIRDILKVLPIDPRMYHRRVAIVLWYQGQHE